MVKNWQNSEFLARDSEFLAKFRTKFALFDKRKMAFLAAKSFGV